MNKADSTVTGAEELGKLALRRSRMEGLLKADTAFPPRLLSELEGVLGRLERERGLPRLLFVASNETIRDAALLSVAMAQAAAERGIEVLLADASFEEPVLAKPFPYQPSEGLSDMLFWGTSSRAALRKTRHERIRVINVGSPPPEAGRVWEEADSDTLLHTLREEASMVIMVGPLRGDGGVPSPLLRKADRTILVCREQEAPDDLSGYATLDRLALLRLGEEEESRPAPKEAGAPSVAREEAAPVRGEKRPARRIPLLPVALLFVFVCVVAGLLLSRFYLNRSSIGEEGVVAAVEETRDEERAEDVALFAPDAIEGPLPPGRGEEEAGSPDDVPVEEAPAAAGDEATKPGDASDQQEPSATEGATEDAASMEPAPVVADASPGPAPVAADGPYYGVHVESFSSAGDAERGAERFRTSRVPVAIVAKEIPGKGVWHRVILGRFAEAAEARAYSEDVKEAFGLSYTLVVRVEP